MDTAACPADVAKARERIENFIFPRTDRIPRWLDEDRGEMLPELAEITGRSQIQLLNDSEHLSICERFNSLYAEALTRKYEHVDRAEPVYIYDIVYYKVGPFYAVVKVHAPVPQPDDPRLASATTGYDSIGFYDDALRLVQSY